MAFFDELGRKISQTGQAAVQKTKDMTDIARLTNSISDEEGRINNNYYLIGKLYVANHASDYENDFAEMIEEIKRSESKIIEYRQQIQNIKGVVRCEKCGAEVSNNVAFCSSCGNPMPKNLNTTDPNLVRCIGCGAMVAKDMKFCTYCGKPINKVTEAVAYEPAVEQTEVASTTSAQTNVKKRCTCGAEVEDDAVFCTECGAKI